MHRTLSSTGVSAVSAMIELAVLSQAAPVALSAIGQRQNISAAYLNQLFALLRRRGLVQSRRGLGGGYSLGRDAEQISVADIVDAVSKSATVTPGGRQSNGQPDFARQGLTHDLWVSVNATLNEWLDAISLKALVDERLAKGASTEVVATPTAPANLPRTKPRAMEVTAPNSVFALGSAASASARWAR